MARQYKDGVTFFKEAKAFVDFARPHLEATEDRNTIVLGIVLGMQENSWVPPLAAGVASASQAEGDPRRC